MGTCQSACHNPCGCGGETGLLPAPIWESSRPDEAIANLLDHYRLGEILGEGSFGVVSACQEIVSGNEYAVKLVDKVESPLADIKREAQMMAMFNHPNIVKCYGVFYDTCFVCIVMSKFDGGDIVTALQERTKLRSCFADYDLVQVKRQMALAIEYLHLQGVVHRDIKGDNFLLDRPALTDPKCQVVLADFGTACSLEPGERLSQACGTKSFWSPEFYSLFYTQKVDIWAMGVICYGLLTGRFPFKGEIQTRTKEVVLPAHAHPDCVELIQSMLRKAEAERADATTLLKHRWLDGTRKRPFVRADSVESFTSVEGGAEFFEEAVDQGVKRRRHSLLDRMQMEHQSKDRPYRLLNHEAREFAQSDRHGRTWHYKWLPRNEMRKHQSMRRFAAPARPASPSTVPGVELPLFAQFLSEYNIKTAAFGSGKAKPLAALAQEVETGASRLMLDAAEHKKLVRVKDVVVLKLVDDKERLLIEVEEHFSDGRVRATGRLPGSKKETHENLRQTARRILEETLNLEPAMVKLDLAGAEYQHQELDSPSFPGLRTVYRKEVVSGHVSTKDPKRREQFLGSGWRATERGGSRMLRWITEEEAGSMQLEEVEGNNNAPSVSSSLVLAPIGLKEPELRQYLEKLQVDVSAYGRDGAKSLKEFSEELIKGEVRLGKGENGEGCVVSEVVNLCIKNSQKDEVLLQVKQVGPGDFVSDKLLLPCASRRPDDSRFRPRHLKHRLA
ncbi:unnamed protein product [Effrenium voratum]|nr:unnamed protein product [Effrenium voratum]